MRTGEGIVRMRFWCVHSYSGRPSSGAPSVGDWNTPVARNSLPARRRISAVSPHHTLLHIVTLFDLDIWTPLYHLRLDVDCQAPHASPPSAPAYRMLLDRSSSHPSIHLSVHITHHRHPRTQRTCATNNLSASRASLQQGPSSLNPPPL